MSEAEQIAAMERDGQRMTEEIARLREIIRYWSYCTREGARQWCPEKLPELHDVFRGLGIHPNTESVE